MSANLAAAISAFDNALRHWLDRRFLNAAREASDTGRYDQPREDGGWELIPAEYGDEAIRRAEVLHENRNHIIRTGNDLVPLLVQARNQELALSVQMIADAARNGNPTHIYETHREVRAKLSVFALGLGTCESEIGPPVAHDRDDLDAFRLGGKADGGLLTIEVCGDKFGITNNVLKGLKKTHPLKTTARRHPDPKKRGLIYRHDLIVALDKERRGETE